MSRSHLQILISLYLGFPLQRVFIPMHCTEGPSACFIHLSAPHLPSASVELCLALFCNWPQVAQLLLSKEGVGGSSSAPTQSCTPLCLSELLVMKLEPQFCQLPGGVGSQKTSFSFLYLPHGLLYHDLL